MKDLNNKDQNFLALLVAGDTEAFEKVYIDYWDVLFKFALQFTKNMDDAKEIVQQVIVSILNLKECPQLKSSLNTYFYFSVRNTAFKLLEKTKRKESLHESYTTYYGMGNTVQMHSKYDTEILDSRFKKVTRQLPGKVREIFELSREENLSSKEIAERLGLSDQTVRNQISKALKIFRLSFQDIIL